MTSVALSHIDKYFPAGRGRRTQVLFDVSFQAAEGELVVLLGPSGCGKSTSLRLIAGLEQADAGEIRIGGEVVNDVPASRRRLAMVFQNYALFPHLTVAENILFGLKVRRVARAERQQRLARAADLLELTPHLQRRPAVLSGGQRQRVALGRALVSGARLVLMDEPLSNLDAKLRQQMRTELRQIQQDLGLTVIYVTHDQVEAMTMADQVVVMREGRVDQAAAPRDLYRSPSRAEVARFIGSPPMNLLPGSTTQGGVRPAGTGITLTAQGHNGGLPGEVLLGLRPEDLRLGQGEQTFEGRLERTELLGADLLAWFDIGARDRLIARLHGSVELEPGTTHRIGFRTRDLHLFDAGTGTRLVTGEPRPAHATPMEETS